VSTPRPGRRSLTVSLSRADYSALRGTCTTLRQAGITLVVHGQNTTSPRASLVVMVLRRSHDWKAMARLVDEGQVGVVALLAHASPEFIRRALATGASGVAPLAVPAPHLVQVIRAAAAGHVLLPAHAVRATLSPPPRVLPPSDRALLRDLIGDVSIADLARQHGCSERTMYRRLNGLYARLQVAGRRAAVQVALSSGLCPEPSGELLAV
jgi:DNA-binding NarL/FixJ family response regulator